MSPDELTESFEQLGLGEGDSVIMHSPLDKIGAVDGGAAMVLHRLLEVLGKGGTLLMPTFTSVTRHASASENFTRPGCWCEGHEDRHLPFIPELQPDRNIGAIAQRLCSWPSSRRSNHPAYSFVAVGKCGGRVYLGLLVRRPPATHQEIPEARSEDTTCWCGFRFGNRDSCGRAT